MLSKKLGFVGVLCAAILLVPLTKAGATTYQWDGANANNGTYDFSGSNWYGTTGSPGASDLVYLGGGDSLLPAGTDTTAQLSADTTVNNYRMGNGFSDTGSSVALDLNGHTFTASATGSGDSYVGSSGTTGTCVIKDSGATKGSAEFGTFHVGYTGGDTGVLQVNGATVNVGAAASSNIGSSGTGTVSVINGGSYNTGTDMSLGYNSGSNGTLTVSGSSSSVTSGGSFYAGRYGTGSLTVSSGAKLTADGTYFRVGHQSGSNGQILITGSGSEIESNRTEIGTSGTGTVTVSDGAFFNVDSYLYIKAGGTLTVDDATVDAKVQMICYDNSTLSFVLNDASDPSFIETHKYLALNSNVDLDLSLGAGASFNEGDFISLITYSEYVSGTFDGLAEGASLSVGGYDFEITYVGGSGGNEVGLTVVPEPTTIGLLAVGGGLALLRRRIR
ncbi:MAG: PEP-CTERM sorting domain-containing protein [Phycisphaerae bacterium]|nr:PEP-CTERM sorting domain-containing protein [Phycisphaerae bacterium]